MTIAATGTHPAQPTPPPGFICWHVAEYYTSPKEGGREGLGGEIGAEVCMWRRSFRLLYTMHPPSFYEYESIGESIVLCSGRSERFLGFGW